MLKKNFVILTMLLLIIHLPSPAMAEEEINQEWNKYVNSRFAYQIDYPSFFIPQPESDNGDGRIFLLESGERVLTVYGSYNTTELSLEEIYNQFEEGYKEKGGEVFYKVILKSGFVMSGFLEDRIFYVKTIRHFTDNDIESDIIFIMEYPEKERDLFDKIVERISSSFYFTEDSR